MMSRDAHKGYRAHHIAHQNHLSLLEGHQTICKKFDRSHTLAKMEVVRHYGTTALLSNVEFISHRVNGSFQTNNFFDF